MSVRAIDSTGDWTFGKGRANYLTGSKEINQRVVTRLRSFTDDWFLDVNAGLPWFDLLGSRNAEKRLLRQIEKTIAETPGIVTVDSIELTSRDLNRGVTIELSYTDVFNNTLTSTVSVR